MLLVWSRDQSTSFWPLLRPRGPRWGRDGELRLGLRNVRLAELVDGGGQAEGKGGT